MSDYSKTTDFAAKDALSSGDSNKVIKGTEFETEFDNIATAIATKYDSTDKDATNGIAGLTAGKILASVIPEATEAAVGGLEVASTVEAAGLTSDNRIITPSKFNDAADAWGQENAGAVYDLHNLVDPNSDRVFGWDDSAGAGIWYTLGTGLESSGASLQVDVATVDHDSLQNFVANEHVDHTSVDITAGTGLSGGGDISATRTLNLDISGLTAMDVTALDIENDGVLVDDGGTMKRMAFDDMGIKVVEFTADQTLALADNVTMQVLTGATGRTVTIPANATTAFKVGSTIVIGSRDTAAVAISPAVGVTLTSKAASGNSDQSVQAGGMVALVKVDTDEWMVSGDLA